MSTKEMYGFSGKLKAKPGKGNELALILLEAAKVVGTLEGNHLYMVGKSVGDSDLIWVTEGWTTKEEHDNSLKMEEVKALIMKAVPLMEGKPEGKELEIVGGAGI